jgi:hypothetical protein
LLTISAQNYKDVLKIAKKYADFLPSWFICIYLQRQVPAPANKAAFTPRGTAAYTLV